jgi:hypothetical protein
MPRRGMKLNECGVSAVQLAATLGVLEWMCERVVSTRSASHYDEQGLSMFMGISEPEDPAALL